MSDSKSGNPYDATGFTFAQAPKHTSFLDPTITQDSMHQSSPSPSVSNFRRSTQRRQPLQTPLRPFAAFPLTPQTPDSQYGQETSHSRDPFLLSAENELSQTGLVEVTEKGDETNSSQHHDRFTETPLAETPISFASTESINNNAASAIQERLARMKQQHHPSQPQAHSSTRQFATFARSMNPTPKPSSSDLFLLPSITSQIASRSMSSQSFADSTAPKREVFNRQQDSTEPVSPMSRSKSAVGHRSSSVENPPSRELSAVLAEALLSAETWNEENGAMVRPHLEYAMHFSYFEYKLPQKISIKELQDQMKSMEEEKALIVKEKISLEERLASCKEAAAGAVKRATEQ